MNSEIDGNRLVIFIVMAILWWWAWDQLMSRSSDPTKSSRHTSPHRVDDQQAAHCCVDNGRCEMVPSGIDRYEGDVARNIKLIQMACPSFDEKQFLETVGIVFEAVAVAFANGNRKLLHDLVSREVFETLSEIITKREQRGECTEFNLVSLEKARIIDVSFFNRRAEITINFVAELITVTRTEAGSVVAGDPVKVMKVDDLWTFTRELTSWAPVWEVTATQPAEAVYEDV